MVFAEIALGFDSLGAILAGTVLWGLHMGASQGLLTALIADSAPEALRGTAFGIFNLVTGLVTLIASALAGLLWTVSGPSLAYSVGAGFAVASAIACLWLEKRPLRTH